MRVDDRCRYDARRRSGLSWLFRLNWLIVTGRIPFQPDIGDRLYVMTTSFWFCVIFGSQLSAVSHTSEPSDHAHIHPVYQSQAARLHSTPGGVLLCQDHRNHGHVRIVPDPSYFWLTDEEIKTYDFVLRQNILLKLFLKEVARLEHNTVMTNTMFGACVLVYINACMCVHVNANTTLFYFID